MSSRVQEHVRHRGGLGAEGHALTPAAGLLDRIGGRATVERLVETLYDRIEADADLRPMFIAHLDGERAKQKDFFCEWLGGEPEWTRHHAYNGLLYRHSHIHITRKAADAWLAHFEFALRAAVESPEHRADIL
jgi:hemoglobin